MVGWTNFEDVYPTRKYQNGEELNNYIINIYITMLTRGIKGTFIYVCNKELREYLREYLS